MLDETIRVLALEKAETVTRLSQKLAQAVTAPKKAIGGMGYIRNIYHALKNKTPRRARLGGFGRAMLTKYLIETFGRVSFQIISHL